MKILVCITDQCFHELRHLDGPDTFFLTDLPLSGDVQGVVVNPLTQADELDLARAAKTWFELLGAQVGLDAFVAYANNGFETVIAPIVDYVEKLKEIVEATGSNQVEVWLRTRYLGQYKTACYFMAEHESQGVRFYDREGVISPYIYDFCVRGGVKVCYVRSSFQLAQRLYNPLRLWLVFFFRLFSDIREAWVASNLVKAQKATDDSAEHDIVVITRSKSQSRSFLGFVSTSELRASFVGGSGFFDRGENFRFLTRQVAAMPGSEVVFPVNIGRTEVIARYLASFKAIITTSIPTFTFRGTEIEMRQAAREIFALMPSLCIYRESLSLTLDAIKTPNWKTMVTFEQKSPHAFVDASVARQRSFACIQVMQCDQHARYLPIGVFGDFFLVDSVQKANDMAKYSPGYEHAIKYIGSFKYFQACDENLLNGKDILLPALPVYCFFTHSNDIESNKLIILLLLKKIGCKQLIIKLHPRDSRKNYTAFPNVSIFDDMSIDREALYDAFDVGVTFPSGVVHELLYGGKVFLLLGFAAGRNCNEYAYWNDEYDLCVSNIESLALIICCNNINSLIQSYEAYRKSYLNSIGLINNYKAMKRALFDLSRTINNI